MMRDWKKFKSIAKLVRILNKTRKPQHLCCKDQQVNDAQMKHEVATHGDRIEDFLNIEKLHIDFVKKSFVVP